MPEEKIYAKYFSPGMLFAETTMRMLDEGTVEEAVKISKEIRERHGAHPFGFDLITMLVAEPIDDGRGGTMDVEPKEIARKGRYFLGGKLIHYDEAVASDGPGSTMCSNMKGNYDPIAIQIDGRYRSTQIFREKDVMVNPETGEVLRRGDEPALVEYRAKMTAQWKEEWEEFEEKRKAHK